MAEVFWLSQAQFSWLEPVLPKNTRRVARVDDRRVICGIVHVLMSGGRRADALAAYGPRKTPYNRFVRWARKGVWREAFETLAAAGGPPAEIMLDSIHAKAPRCAAGGKRRRSPRPSAAPGRARRQSSCCRRSAKPAHRLRRHPWAAWRSAGRDIPDRADAGRPDLPGRLRLRQPWLPKLLENRGTCAVAPNNRPRKHPLSLRTPGLPTAQTHRAHVQSPQGFPPRRHPLR